MFGLSPNKLLFTALIIAVVWYGFKWLGRYQQAQKSKAANNERNKASPERSEHATQNAKYEELVACPDCGDYVVANRKTGCGKTGCPYDK